MNHNSKFFLSRFQQITQQRGKETERSNKHQANVYRPWPMTSLMRSCSLAIRMPTSYAKGSQLTSMSGCHGDAVTAPAAAAEALPFSSGHRLTANSQSTNGTNSVQQQHPKPKATGKVSNGIFICLIQRFYILQQINVLIEFLTAKYHCLVNIKKSLKQC